MNPQATLIKEKIEAQRNEEKATWLENYVKHDIRSLGVGIPEIRNILKTLNKENGFTLAETKQQVDMLNDLMKETWTEHKLAAILYIQIFWLKTFGEMDDSEKLMTMISDWFDQTLVFDWNVCDWLCVRILSPLLDRHPDLIIDYLTQWNGAEYLWKARASLVPFAQCKDLSRYQNEIFDFSSELIRRDERFCKTAVGWVLREWSKINSDDVTSFLRDFEPYMTREVVRNATKHMNGMARD